MTVVVAEVKGEGKSAIGSQYRRSSEDTAD
jgi:hypothetical protein